MFETAIIKRLIKYWQENQLTEPGDNVLVACSGGPDSVALLDIVYNLRHRLGINVYAAHFEHGIRGEESIKDADYVLELCQQRNISCFLGHGNIPVLAKESNQSLETCAREERYRFLRECLSKIDGGVIATAHHQDDQAETVLMHLLRGSGIKGLSGMLPKRKDVIRPLLCVEKADLIEYCSGQGLEYRIDETNLTADCFRNKLRLELMPKLQDEYNPSLVRALCNLADVAAGDEEFLAQQTQLAAAKLIRAENNNVICNIEGLLDLPSAMQRRLVQFMASKLDTTLSFQHVQSVLGLCRKRATGAAAALPEKLNARINYDFLYFSKNDIIFSENSATIRDKMSDGLWLEPNSRVQLPSGDAICLELFDIDSFKHVPGFGTSKIYMDCDKCQFPLLVRNREPGDRIAIKSGHKKLKDFFVDAKIDRRDRDSIPLVCNGVSGEILWVAGLRQTSAALADVNTNRYAVLTLTRKEENQGYD